MKNQDLDIITVEGELSRSNEDLMKLLKIALVELKYINGGIKKPIVERPTCRIKSIESIYNKISKKEELNCRNFTVKMNDLLGIRVICSNLSSLDEVWRKLYFSESLKFSEISIRLEDAADGYPDIDFNKFDPNIVRIEKPVDGYRGIHLIFSAKESILSNPELKGEIQLRTIAQHYWATFSHDDIYKENPYLEKDEQKQLIFLSNNLYDIDKNFSSLGFNIKANPLEINKEVLDSLFNELGIHFDNEDIDKLIDLILKHKLVPFDLTNHRIRVKDYEDIKDALSSGKNKFNADISGIDEYINDLYNLIFKRKESKIEAVFCRLYAYFKGRYWPKRRLLEYILKLKTENWSNVLGNNSPSNLVTLLEAFIHKKVEKHSYYFSGIKGEKYSDSTYLFNRGIKRLSEIGLVTEKFYENVKNYPYPRADNFSYKKDTYEVECTPKGKNVAKEIIEELFLNNSNLKSILDNLEIEDFPKIDFPYEKPSYWGFPRRIAVFEKKKWVMERDLELTTEDWWTDNLGYLKKIID